jgi:hypothetical protein
MQERRPGPDSPPEIHALPPITAADRRRVGTIERHLQTLLLSIATAAVISLVAFVWNAQGVMSRFDERFNTMAADLSRLSDAMEAQANRSETKADHDRDMGPIREDLVDHEARLRDLEDGRRISHPGTRKR